jgi:hypothetical protein
MLEIPSHSTHCGPAVAAGLVENVSFNFEGGQSEDNSLLFLTNKQATDFDFGNMARLMDAMDIPEPKLVINLIGALNGVSKTAPSGSTVHYAEERENKAGKWGRSTVLSHHTYAERSEKELLETDERLGSFLEEHLLPVAIQTQALILVHSKSCHMSFVFDKICSDYAKTVPSGKLPFTVMHFNSAYAGAQSQ